MDVAFYIAHANHSLLSHFPVKAPWIVISFPWRQRRLTRAPLHTPLFVCTRSSMFLTQPSMVVMPKYAPLIPCEHIYPCPLTSAWWYWPFLFHQPGANHPSGLSPHALFAPGWQDTPVLWTLLPGLFLPLTHPTTWHICTSLSPLSDSEQLGEEAKMAPRKSLLGWTRLIPLLFPDAITDLCQECLCPWQHQEQVECHVNLGHREILMGK